VPLALALAMALEDQCHSYHILVRSLARRLTSARAFFRLAGMLMRVPIMSRRHGWDSFLIRFIVDKLMSEARIRVKRNMTPTSNRLIVEWIPTTKVGSIYMPQSELDYWNTDSVKMFKVIAAGPGRITRKGVFIPNEIHAGANVIINARTGGRPEPIGNGRYLVKNPDEVVIGVCPVET